MRGYRERGAAAAVIGGAALAVGLAACGGEAESAAREVEYTRAISVEVIELAPEPFTEFIRLVGVVQPNRDVTVSAEEGGVVRSLHVEKGTRVTAGQPILKIDDTLLQSQLDQAQADAGLARETYERQRRLWEDEEVGSELAYLQARYRAEAAEAHARTLATRVERTMVRSPIAGILDARMVEVGSMVAAGAPVARIVDVATVKVAAGVPERFAGEVGVGAEARIALDVLAGRDFTGRLQFVGTAVDDGSRTFPIEIGVANPGGALKPGLVANVGIARRSLDAALVVPQEALLRVEDGFVAYVAVQNGVAWRAEARPVVTGASRGGRVAIESGLDAGDHVIVVGQQQVAAGDVLRIVGRD